MAELKRVWVATSLTQVFENLRKQVATDMKKKYNLQEVTVPRSLASEILAEKMKGKKFLNFKFRKQGLNKGVLELL